MSIKTLGAVTLGLDGHIIHITAHRVDGLPGMDITGLPAFSVKEARVRVRSALCSGGYEWPSERLAVVYTPGDLPKHGTALDLPLAMCALGYAGAVPAEALERTVFFGELALDGTIRPVPGAVNVALAARDAGFRMVCAPECAAEAAATGVEVYALGSLKDVVYHLLLNNHTPFKSGKCKPHNNRAVDMAVIRVEAHARRALEVAAAGGHNMLLIGPPGCGKTLLARALTGILPPLTHEEAVEVTKIRSVSGLTGRHQGLVTQRPFRAPHPTASEAALTGGGNPPLPGEVSLAHHGVLFMDEAAEFRRASLDALGGAAQAGHVTITRARHSHEFPCSMRLVLATNPCPCGYLGDIRQHCRCTPAVLRTYLQRLAGPLLDQVDIRINLAALPAHWLTDTTPAETSAVVQERVIAAHKRQEARNGAGVSNAGLDLTKLKEVAPLGEVESRFLARSGKALGVHARALPQVLRVARTIADLGGAPAVTTSHLAEALSYSRINLDPNTKV